MGSERHSLEAQHDGTCPDCGRYVELSCSVHGHLDGDPWAWREVAQELAEALRTFQAMAAPGSPRRKRVDPVLARFDALNTEEKR